MNVVSYEFLECVGDGGNVDDFSYEGGDVDGVECLRKVYCYECCSVWWSFLVEACDYWIYYGV